MSRVVAIVSHQGAIGALGDLASADLSVAAPPGDAPGQVDLMFVLQPIPSWVERILTFARRTALGRNAVRLTPLDPSRRLWRAARRDARLAELVRSADVVVAVDRDAIFTVWKMTRSRRYGTAWAAVYGASAARFALDAMRAAGKPTTA